MNVKDLTKLLKGELTDQIAAYINAENPFPENMINWLAQLVLLHNVPFNNLVADEALLPNESIRLFYLDKNWTNALLDGALSIGIHSDRDLLLQSAMNDIIRRESNKKLATLSKKSQGNEEKQIVQLGTISGLLIRSSIVSNYKGLEIGAFDHEESPVNLLRAERLSSNVMLILFDTVPTKIEIKTPSESRPLAIINNEITLRQIENEVGKLTNKTLKITDTQYRHKEKRVLNINKLQQALAKELGKQQLSPAEFGIQLIQSPKVFQLVNDDIAIPKSRAVITETPLDKQMIVNKLFQ